MMELFRWLKLSRLKNDELKVTHVKLPENFEHLDNGSKVIKGELILNSPNVMHNLNLHIQNSFPNYLLLLL